MGGAVARSGAAPTTPRTGTTVSAGRTELTYPLTL